MEDDQKAVNFWQQKTQEQILSEVKEIMDDAEFMKASLDRTIQRPRKIAVMTMGGYVSGKTAAMIEYFKKQLEVEIVNIDAPKLVVDSYSMWLEESLSLRTAQNGLHAVKQVASPIKTNSRNPMRASGAEPWKKKGRR